MPPVRLQTVEAGHALHNLLHAVIKKAHELWHGLVGRDDAAMPALRRALPGQG